ncbi:hypothetical protein P5705_21010 [Pseudomonas entomophila]|nr:hypothetical protein [Pseudomonas entomophila]MDF9620135.1 hypothetical protein [Pseudomonas entomophila]
MQRGRSLYGQAVGQGIAELLKVYEAPAVLAGAQAQYLPRVPE